MLLLSYFAIDFEFQCLQNKTRICANLGSRMKFKTLCYPVGIWLLDFANPKAPLLGHARAHDKYLEEIKT